MNGFMSLFSIADYVGSIGLRLAVYAGASAGLLAIVVLAINVLFRRWLSSRQVGLLWGVVLLRLLIPIAPASFLSLQHLLPSVRVDTSEVIRGPADHPDTVGYSQSLVTTPRALDVHAPTTRDADRNASAFSFTIKHFLEMLPVFWLIGGAVCLVGTVLVHWQFCRRLKRVVDCDDQRLINLWNDCHLQARVHRNIPILLFEGVSQPAVLGLFRPKLLLPPHALDLSDENLRMVMLHELAHVRHWDIPANWALVVIRAIHWWNPIYWLAAARFQNLREQACDAFVIQRLAGQPTRSYSELLLTLVQRQPSGSRWRVMLPASILGFDASFFRKSAIRNRLKALRFAGVKRSRWHTAGAACLIGLVAICGLTDASTPKALEKSSDWLPRAGHDWNSLDSSVQVDPGPIVTRTYDIEAVLNRIAVDKQTNRDSRDLINPLLQNLLRGLPELPHLSSAQIQQQDTPDTSRGSIVIDGAMLIVSAPLLVHAEVLRYLKAWEQSGLGQICVETRFITHDSNIASAIGVSWQYLEAFSADQVEEFPSESRPGMPVVRAKATVDDYLPVAVATLNADQASALIQAAQGERRANVLQAPKVTLFNGQLASIFDCTQTPFVIGIQDAKAGVQQPKIAVVDEGIKLVLRAVQSNAASKVQLDARVELSHIDEVRTASAELRGGAATIQIPRVNRCRIDISSEVEYGQTLLIGCIPSYNQKRFLYVLLSTQNVSELAKEMK